MFRSWYRSSVLHQSPQSTCNLIDLIEKQKQDGSRYSVNTDKTKAPIVHTSARYMLETCISINTELMIIF